MSATAAVLAAAITALVTMMAARLPRPAARCPAPPGRPGRDVGGHRAGLLTHHGDRSGRNVRGLRATSETLVETLLEKAIETMFGPVRRRRHRRAVDRLLPDVIDMLVLAVHAGSSPAQAVDQIRPLLTATIRPAFDLVVHRLQRGRGLADAVGALPELLGHRAVALADGIAAADRYGLPLGPVLDGLADEARAERRRLGEAHARSLSVKLSFPLVACTLPAFVLIAIVPAVIGSLASLPTSPLRP